MGVVAKSVRPEWASVPLRVDPMNMDRIQEFEMTEDGEQIMYRVDGRGAVVKRRLERSGLPISIALPPSAFLGVAARAIDDGAGNVTVTLELHHSDPSCSVPLLVANDLYDVAADWRGWSERFGLPMLMVEADGSVKALEETLGDVRIAHPTTRRYSPSRKRRPRFLARRRPGGLGMRLVVAGDEIIARS